MVLESWSGGLARLSNYFDDLARSWRGWPGTKDWSDNWGLCQLSATHDGVGHVNLAVKAAQSSWKVPGWWEAEAILQIEPGSLPDTALRVRRFLDI
jgi:hypothetical protein